MNRETRRKEYTRLSHEFEPVFDKNSRILILGTFPSVKSREQAFYYGHPQNRFWKVLSQLLGETLPETIAQKKAMLLKHGVAVWDVIESCDIAGSSDSSIRNVVPADLSLVLSAADIRSIYANGGTAKRLFDRYQKKTTRREIIGLPSTSPANAAWNLPRLIGAWSCITENLSDEDPPASADRGTPGRGTPVPE